MFDSFRSTWGSGEMCLAQLLVDRREAPRSLALRRGPRDADPARADEVDDTVRAAELVERIQLLRRARQLEHDRVGADVEEPPAGRLGGRDELGAPLGRGR